MPVRRLVATFAAAPLALGLMASPQTAAAQTLVAQQTTAARPTSSAANLTWAEKMFDERSHDFGTVARGAEVRYQLRVTNPYEETVRLVGIDKTCGCTAATADFRELKTHEVGHIEVAMDTVKFIGEKKSNVLVDFAFEGGSVARVQVPIRSMIRSDVVVQPGSADFGRVAVGSGERKVLKVDYAGRGDWRIEDVQSGNPNVDVQFRETGRTAGSVAYELAVALKPGTPVGDVLDRLVLKTNDPSTTDVPVLVKATVEPDIVVSPANVAFGPLRPGQKKTVSVVVRGKKPFQISDVVSQQMDCFAVRLDSTAMKPVHVVPLTIEVPDMAGDIDETFEVSVAGRDEPLTFQVSGTVTR